MKICATPRSCWKSPINDGGYVASTLGAGTVQPDRGVQDRRLAGERQTLVSLDGNFDLFDSRHLKFPMAQLMISSRRC
jgi:hypothetical protein